MYRFSQPGGTQSKEAFCDTRRQRMVEAASIGCRLGVSEIPVVVREAEGDILFSPTLKRRAAVTQVIWMLEDIAQLNIVLVQQHPKGKEPGTCILESDDSSMVICRLQFIRKPDVKARADAIPQSGHARFKHL